VHHGTASWRHVTVTNTGEKWSPQQNSHYPAIDQSLTVEKITIKWANLFLLSKFVLKSQFNVRLCFSFFIHFSAFLLPTQYRRRVLLMHLITPNHIHTRTYTLGRTPLDEESARSRDLYLTTQNKHKKQTSLPSAGFEPAIPPLQWLQSYALDLATPGIGWYFNSRCEVYTSDNICANV